MNTHCLYCNKRLGFFHSKSKPFCSEVHEDRYMEKEAQDALTRLTEDFDLPTAPTPLQGTKPPFLPANAPLPPIPIEVLAETDPPLVTTFLTDMGALSTGIPPAILSQHELLPSEEMLTSQVLLQAWKGPLSSSAALAPLPVELPKTETESTPALQPALPLQPTLQSQPPLELKPSLQIQPTLRLQRAEWPPVEQQPALELHQMGEMQHLAELKPIAMVNSMVLQELLSEPVAATIRKPIAEWTPSAPPEPPPLFSTTLKLQNNPLPLLDSPALLAFSELAVAWVYPLQVVPAPRARSISLLPMLEIAAAPQAIPAEAGPEGREFEPLPRPEPVHLRVQRDPATLLKPLSRTHTLRRSRVSMPWKPLGLGFSPWQTQPQFRKLPLSFPEAACSPKAL